jgi:hypothetical protein
MTGRSGARAANPRAILDEKKADAFAGGMIGPT